MLLKQFLHNNYLMQNVFANGEWGREEVIYLDNFGLIIKITSIIIPIISEHKKMELNNETFLY